jgi:cobalt/nickel transport system permease protein
MNWIRLELNNKLHIPDGFLDSKVWTTTTLVGAGALAYALNKTKLTISRKEVPKIALIGAFIFAAQMINFPIAGATSGHFLGGTLASILFGPFIGFIMMSCVLIVQAFVFQDGGITALGANIFCTGLVGCTVGYIIYKSGMRLTRGRWHNFITPIVTFFAAWCSIVAASACVSLLLAWSGIPLQVALPAMVGWHSLIGIGEGLITTMVISYLVERKTLLNTVEVSE